MLDLFRATVVLIVVLVVPRLADACSCLAASPCRQYATAGAVFAGDVLEVTAGPESGRPTPKIARLRVVRAYKGPMRVGQVVAVEMPGGSSASCSLDIAKGSRYVIYGGLESGRVTTNLCRGSYALAAGQPWPTLPPQAGTVSGRLVRAADTGGAPRAVPGVVVSIDAAGRRITATTDADGAFRLAQVPAGRWPLAFALRAGEQAEATVDLQSADDCAELFVPVQSRER
jgi:hypothetical protein